jgi:hypothetical protein
MPAGERQQLIYDLTARVVDSESVSVDMVIVSAWARTGWNVVTPNVLVDATATRDAVAWQQLRGRAMRADRRWNAACFQLTLMLLGSSTLGVEDLDALPGDVAATLRSLSPAPITERSLSEADRRLLDEAYRASTSQPDARLLGIIAHGSLADMSAAERRDLAVRLLLWRNKVTHIYELVKASGAAPQVRYDRGARRWGRSDNIAHKHAAEFSVHPVSGAYAAGAEHAPLVYAGDPRRSTPAPLTAALRDVLEGADARIARAWVEAVVHEAAPLPVQEA